MIGDKKGFTGERFQVCEIVFSAEKAAKSSDYNISLSNVNVVDSELTYTEGRPHGLEPAGRAAIIGWMQGRTVFARSLMK